MDTAENVVQVQEAGYKRLGKTRRDETRMGESSGAFTTRGERETLENIFQEPKTAVETN